MDSLPLIIERLNQGCSRLPFGDEALQRLVLRNAQEQQLRLDAADLPGCEPSQRRLCERLDGELRLLQAGGAKRKLEKLAERTVREEFFIAPEQVKLSGKLVDLIDEPAPPPPAPRPNHIAPCDYAAEVHKRLVINTLIQGAAHRAQYRFLLEKNDLEEISPGLTEKYRRHMTLADQGIWVGDEGGLDLQGFDIRGLVSLDCSTKPPTINARATSFPLLIHELAKGAMELLALHGLPQDARFRKAVLQEADRPELEFWGLRLGGGLFASIMEALPVEALPQRAAYLRKLFSLPANEFVALMEECAAGDASRLREIFKDPAARGPK